MQKDRHLNKYQLFLDLMFYSIDDETFNDILFDMNADKSNEKELVWIIQKSLSRVLVYDFETQRYYAKQQINGCKQYYLQPYTTQQLKNLLMDTFGESFGQWYMNKLQQNLSKIGCVSFINQFRFKTHQIDYYEKNGKEHILQYDYVKFTNEFKKYVKYLLLLNNNTNTQTININVKDVNKNSFLYFINYIWKLSQVEYLEDRFDNVYESGFQDGFIPILKQTYDQLIEGGMKTAITINVVHDEYDQIQQQYSTGIRHFIQPFLDCLYEGEILEISRTKYIKDHFSILGPVKLIIYKQDDSLSEDELLNEYAYLQQIINNDYIGFTSLTDDVIQKRNDIGCIIIGSNINYELLEKSNLLYCSLNLGNINTLQNIYNNFQSQDPKQYDFRYYTIVLFIKFVYSNFHPKKDLPINTNLSTDTNIQESDIENVVIQENNIQEDDIEKMLKHSFTCNSFVQRSHTQQSDDQNPKIQKKRNTNNKKKSV